MRKFFTADTHFGHLNIIKYCNRPFDLEDEMTAELIKRWNEIVGNNDLVYHLGDFAFGSADYARWVRNQLKGRIILIRGNHEKPALEAHKRWHIFEEVRDYLTTEVNGTSVVLSHYPFRSWDKMHRGALHFFGHVHGKLDRDLLPGSLDVGVDSNNFYPWSEDQLEMWFEGEVD